jgi:hypothetical protein
MRIWLVLAFSCLLSAGLVTADPADFLQTPADALAIALADAKTNPANVTTLRYLWLANSADKATLRGTLAFAVNSLSSRKIPHSLTVLNDSVLRLDLHALGIKPEAWEDLGRSGSGPARATKGIESPEPYFHLLKSTTIQEFREVLVDVPAYVAADGRTYTRKWSNEPTGKSETKTQLLHGPWLPAEQVKELCALTQTDFPILRGDWFIANALLPPAYYNLLGVKDLKAFDELVRFRSRDEDMAVKGVVNFSSEVAIHNRALLRSPTVFDYYWKSFDFQTSIAGQDMMANVLSSNADAHEFIARLPNGLQGYFLTDGNYKRIDFADPNIAVDRSTAWDNKLVWSGYSCMTCHKLGLKSFSDDVRKLADTNRRIFALVRQENLDKFTDLFAPNIADFVTSDQAKYAIAVQTIAGCTPEENAKNLAKLFLGYVQAPITLTQASLETGYPEAKIVTKLKATQGLDHSLVQLLAGSPVRRDQFERSGFGQLMTLMATETK